MSTVQSFKQRLTKVSRLGKERDYDTALADIESMLEKWPGNAKLHLLRSNFIQLQDDPSKSLAEAKESVQEAISLAPDSPVEPIELGYFMDNVEDDPRAAAKSFAHGIAMARRVLVEGLIGRAKSLNQLEKTDEVRRCISEILYILAFEEADASREPVDRIWFQFLVSDWLKRRAETPYRETIEEILTELAQ